MELTRRERVLRALTYQEVDRLPTQFNRTNSMGQDRRVRIATLNLPGSAEFSLDAIGHDADTPWTDYVRGAASVLDDDGLELVGFDGLLHSTVPFGSGLSSSAAIGSVALLAFAEHVTREYRGATGIEPSVYGVDASPGACELALD